MRRGGDARPYLFGLGSRKTAGASVSEPEDFLAFSKSLFLFRRFVLVDGFPAAIACGCLTSGGRPLLPVELAFPDVPVLSPTFDLDRERTSLKSFECMALFTAESLSDEEPGGPPGPRGVFLTFLLPISPNLTSSDLKSKLA